MSLCIKHGFTLIDKVNYLRYKPSISPFIRILEPLHVYMASIPYWSTVLSRVVKTIILGCGVFESRTYPWSPSKVEVGTFYSFTLKVGSKYTYILHEALV